MAPKRQPSPEKSDEGETALRKSSRKRKPLFSVTPGASSAPFQHQWTEEESAALLRQLVLFKSTNNGVPPTPTQIVGPIYESIKNSLPSSEITPKMLLNKTNRLRRRYKEAPPDADTPLLRLSAKLWGPTTEEEEEEEEEEESEKEEEQQQQEIIVGEQEHIGSSGGGKRVRSIRRSFPYFYREMKEYLDATRIPMDALDLELVDTKKAEALETKWRELAASELRLRLQGIDLEREICSLLLDLATRSSPS